MAITFDSTASAESTTDPGTLTFSMTVASGSNRLMVVAVASRSIGMTVASVTFDGVSFTKAVDVNADFNQAALWYLIAPNVTTANVVVTLNAGTFVWSTACAVALQGVLQSSPVDGTDTNSVLAATINLPALTTTVDGCAVVDAMASNSGGPTTMTAETNRVERMNRVPSGSGSASTIITKSPAGACTMEWSTGGSVNNAMAAAAFKPAAGGNSRYYRAQQ